MANYTNQKGVEISLASLQSPKGGTALERKREEFWGRYWRNGILVSRATRFFKCRDVRSRVDHVTKINKGFGNENVVEITVENCLRRRCANRHVICRRDVRKNGYHFSVDSLLIFLPF